MNTANTTNNLALELRKDFPIFSIKSERPLAYLDSGASSQKPACVIERMNKYYNEEHANIHRGAYRLSALATQSYEQARDAVAKFLNASESKNIIFTRGTTESINLVSHSIENWLRPGDTILLTIMEHHSNIVPWQLLAERKKLKIEFVDINPCGTLNKKDLEAKFAEHKPKLFAFTYISNALGTINPVAELIELANKYSTLTLLDVAQAVPHIKIDLQKLPVDFLAFSGHKIYGPTGIGVLYAKSEHLEKMSPFMGGGDMIRTVSVHGSTFADAPQKFEAGTPPIAEALGLKSALDYLSNIGFDKIKQHDSVLLQYAFNELNKIPGIKLYGPITEGIEQASILSFNLQTIHPHDLATIADSFNVQFRAGHHCAMPLMHRLGLQATARISFGIYNTTQDIDQLIESLKYAGKLLG